MSARENILARIRGSLRRDSNDGALAQVQAHIAARALSPRPNIGGDLAALFKANAVRLLSTIAEVPLMRDVPATAAAYLRAHDLPLQAVCWPGLSELDWAGSGIPMENRPARESDLVGVTSVFCAIAETGTLMTLSGPRTPATTSLLPETHIAVVRASRLVRGMEDAWKLLRDEHGADFMPRALNFISGPSRTADIEQTLVLGAHGPYRVHIVLVGDPPAD